MLFWKYFKGAFFFTLLGLVAAFFLGWSGKACLSEGLRSLFVCSVLAILETSLSFDNAIVNARILRGMAPLWQKAFLTWGILFAVFGMRIVFPLIIVAFIAAINPLSALKLAIYEPEHYADIIGHAHLSLSAFGGTFLLLVSLKFFIDADKEVHWLLPLERLAAKLAALPSSEVLVALGVIFVFHQLLPAAEAASFVFAALWGLFCFLLVEGLGHLFHADTLESGALAQKGLMSFLYLEVLDASFSFDGVVGAFALSTNLFLIALGLGIGSFYVRSLTLLLVDKGTLGAYIYLEHGAFYAIFALALLMYSQVLVDIPEYITGLTGVAFIAASFIASVLYNRKESQRKL